VKAKAVLAGELGVLGDIHCEDVALKAARALFAERGVSRILAVGDLVDGRGDPHRTLELLNEVDAVAGNHRWYRHAEFSVEESWERFWLDRVLGF
jgi:predicted phosphodiesterase